MADMAMDKEDLRALYREAYERALRNWPTEVLHHGVRTTSGSSGIPLVAFHDWRFFPVAVDAYVSGDHDAGPAIVFYGSRLHHLSCAVGMIGAQNPTQTYFASIHDSEEKFSFLLKEMQPKMLGGFPSFIATMLSRVQVVQRSVTELRLAGEPISVEQKRIFKSFVPNAVIKVLYASVELGMISDLPCGHTAENVYHPAQNTLIEILNKDEDGVGEIVVSKQMGEGSFIEKYHTGDAAREVTGGCPCGASFSFELLGRFGYDYVKVAGGLLIRKEVERVMELLPGISDYCFYAGTEVTENGSFLGKIVLEIQGELPSSASVIADTVSKELFLTPTQTLYQLIGKGLFSPLQIANKKTPETRISPKVIRLRSLSDFKHE